MKIPAAKVAAFVSKPNPAVRLALVYGTDAGLVRETANALARTVVDDPSDPFRIANLTAKDVSDDPALLRDEAAAIAMGGGRRVVRLDGVRDTQSAQIKDFLDDPAGDALVILEAEMLNKRSRLRSVVEAAANAAALPCFADEGARLETIIRDGLAAENLSANRDALGYLAAHLGGDRLATRRELEKLALFVGSGRSEPITLDEAAASVGDTAALTLTDLAHAVGEGRPAVVERCFDKALAEGASETAALRAVGRHVRSLLEYKAERDTGRSAAEAAKRLRPPVYGLHAARLEKQHNALNNNILHRVLEILIEAEIRCKSTGVPADAVCADALLRLSVAANRAARGGRGGRAA